MSDATKQTDSSIKKSTQRWQSDVVVDLIKQYGFPYIALNPGASFRGLRFAGQLRREPAADAPLQPRENRGADRPWLRQGERQADDGYRP